MYKSGNYKKALEHSNTVYERNSLRTDNLLLGAIYYQVSFYVIFLYLFCLSFVRLSDYVFIIMRSAVLLLFIYCIWKSRETICPCSCMILICVWQKMKKHLGLSHTLQSVTGISQMHGR